MTKHVGKLFLTAYHFVQYVLHFIVLLLIGRRLVELLYSPIGTVVLAVVAGYITVVHYMPGDCPWWWAIIKKRRAACTRPGNNEVNES